MNIKALTLSAAALALVSGGVFSSGVSAQTNTQVAQTSNNQNQPMQSQGGAGPTEPKMDPNSTTSPAVNPPGSNPGSNSSMGGTTSGNVGTTGGGMTGGGMTNTTGSMGTTHPMVHRTHHVVHHKTHHTKHHAHHTTHATGSTGTMGTTGTTGTTTTPGDQGSNPGGTTPH
jgi:hypothetical protein